MGPTSWNCRHRWCTPSHSSHFIGKMRTKSSKTIPKSSDWRPVCHQNYSNHGILDIAGEISHKSQQKTGHCQASVHRFRCRKKTTRHVASGGAEQHARAEHFPKGAMSWGSLGRIPSGILWWLEDDWTYLIWVCLKIGYIPNYSHLIGIMIINQKCWVNIPNEIAI